MDRGRMISLQQLPDTYSTIYLLSTLDAPVLQEAEKAGLIRPELKRAELVARRRRRVGGAFDRAALRARRRRVQREKERLEEGWRRIEAALAEVEG